MTPTPLFILGNVQTDYDFSVDLQTIAVQFSSPLTISGIFNVQQLFYITPGITDLSMTTYPLITFPDKVTGINYLLGQQAPTMIAQANANFGGTEYVGYTYATFVPDIQAAIDAVAIQSDWNQTNTSALDYIKGKPSLSFSAVPSALTGITIVGTGATGAQASTTKFSQVKASFSTSVTVTLSGSPISRVIGKVCPTNSATESDWIEGGRTSTAQPTTVAVAVGQVTTNEGQITLDVPAGYYYKFVNTGSTGTHTEAFVAATKTVFG